MSHFEHRIIPIDSLIPYINNARTHSDAQIAQLAGAISEFGFTNPLLVDEENNVIAGHGRLLAARKLDLQEVPAVVVTGLDDNRRKALILADNKLALNAEWDDELLALELDALGESAELTGFTEDELLSLLGGDPNEGLTDDDAVPEVPDDPISKRGDIWLCGNHRVMCGDSTSVDDVEKLMDRKKANLCFTSPPYWVGKEYEYQNTEGEIDSFIAAISTGIAVATSAEYGRVVINTGTASINRIDKKRKVEILPLIDKWQRELRQYGWLIRHLRIWAKRGQLPASISPKTDVIDQHNEYIAEFENEYSQIPTFWNQAGQQRGQERIGMPWAQQGLWDDVHGNKSAGGKHVAAFPVEIPSRNIRLYTKAGEIVFEPFAGSGTTIVAAEKHNRICCGMEMDEKYCDVTIERWQEFTGKEATLESTGETFNATPR